MQDNEIRCGHCGRLLAKGEAMRLAIKCPRCGVINHITNGGRPEHSTGRPHAAG